LSGVLVIASYALQESLRRKVFPIVLVLTAAFLGLYGFGIYKAWASIEPLRQQTIGSSGVLIDEGILFSATLFGLSMFGTLFLATVLAIFFTHAVVRGDAERGLLQPLVVRPLGRRSVLAGRFAAGAVACSLYVALVYACALLITHAVTGWWPDRIVQPAVELAGAVIVLVALSLLGSVFLSAIANGIAVFMIFGAGLVAGLLGQIGEALNSDSLNQIATISSWVLPFEALYQDALNAITAETTGFTKAALSLGPFGGAQEAGIAFAPYVLGYLAMLAFLAAAGFARRDL
jgi:Cu-processing system permease protein